MGNFRQFIEQTEEQEKNIKETLAKLPKSHTNLIKDYKIKWCHNNTLFGDSKHVGMLNPNNKTITIAASYNFGREHVFIHELAHQVWQHFVLPNKVLLEKWKKIVANTKNKPKNENEEECFAHAYAVTYCKNPVQKFNFPEWIKFIKALPK